MGFLQWLCLSQILSYIRFSNNFWLVGLNRLVVESIGLVSRFISSDLNFSSLFVNGPLRSVVWINYLIVLYILIGFSNNCALSNWIVICLVLSWLLDLSLIGIYIWWLISLVVRIILTIIVLHILLLLLLCLLRLVVYLLSILIISHCCFAWSFIIANLKVVLVTVLLYQLSLWFYTGLNSMQVQVSLS